MEFDNKRDAEIVTGDRWHNFLLGISPLGLFFTGVQASRALSPDIVGDIVCEEKKKEGEQNYVEGNYYYAVQSSPCDMINYVSHVIPFWTNFSQLIIMRHLK